MDVPPGSRLSIPIIVAAFALGLLLALTLLPPASTRIQVWPWAFYAALFWLIPLLVAPLRLALSLPHSRLGGLLDFGIGALALAGLFATALSPLRATLAPHLLPFLGALALPYALLPVLRSPRADTAAAAFLYPLLFTTLFLWLSSQSSLLGPYARNAEPFGHPNTTGAVCALAACWLTHLALRAGTRIGQALHAVGIALAVALAASSSSRGAVLALAGAAVVAFGLRFLRSGRLLPVFAVAALALATAFLSNQRLRDLVFSGTWSASASESNAQRLAMIQGGFALLAERPLSGWGPGAVPHVFPRVRAELPGQPDNFLQLHNGPAQVAATLGVFGLAALTLLIVALVQALRVRANLFTPSRHPAGERLLAPPSSAELIAATLTCGLILTLFDHSFAVPAFAVLAALPLAALAIGADGLVSIADQSPAQRANSARSSGRRWAWSLYLPIAILALPVARDLQARAAWSDALAAAGADEPAPFVAALRRALDYTPADPFYADQLASHLATGHPFAGLGPPDPVAAAQIYEATLARHPNHEVAHYNLGWLLLAEPDPAPAPARRARGHFAATAQLAPARGEVYLGLALAHLLANDGSSPVPALAAEVLLDPSFAWSPRWRDAALAPHRSAALEHAADFLRTRQLGPAFAALLRDPGPPLDAATSAYRRVRPGHGVLYGHPDGRPPADVNVLLRLELPHTLAAQLPSTSLVTPAQLLACAGLAP